MSRRYDDDMVLFEKRAVNKKGLFVLFLLTVVIFGAGGYYIYKNKDKFEWELKLPWEKDDEYEVLGSNNGENTTIKKNNNSNNKLIVPSLTSEIINRDETNLRFYGIEADDKGYTIKVDFMSLDGIATIQVEKILIDGHDTSATFTLTDNVDEGVQNPTTTTVRILKTELDALNIVCFKKMTVYYRLTSNNSKNNLIRVDVNAFTEIEYNNEIEGLIEMYSGGDVVSRYYRTLTDKDYTYIYFDFLNVDKNISRTIKVKKLLINDEIYDIKEFNQLLYAGSEKVFYIAIPRNKIKNVEKFTISFFIINRTNEKDNDGVTAVYTTPEYTKTF